MKTISKEKLKEQLEKNAVTLIEVLKPEAYEKDHKGIGDKDPRHCRKC